MLLEEVGAAPAVGISSRQFGFAPAPHCCEGLVVVELGQRTLAFSEVDQAIYELNDLAAFVWRSLDAGMSGGTIIRELTVAGVDVDQAERAVGFARTERLRLGAETAPSPSHAGQLERLTQLSIEIAGVAVHLHLSNTLVADVREVFGLLTTDSPDADIILCARVAGDAVDIFSPGQPDWSCARSQFIPLLKAKLIECVLQFARYEVALHAAAIVRGEGAMLLVGSPGAGKTTLAIALAKAGLAVLADDVVLLDKYGLVTGVSLPFTAKSSSWHLLSQRWPGIADHPSHCRPDGQTLCYIPNDPLEDMNPRKISTIFILNRQDEGCASAEELDLTSALVALVAEGATRDERLNSIGFAALVDGLRGARCCRLTYSDFGEAAEAVCSFGS